MSARKADVEFTARRGRSSHCTCTACFDVGEVTVITLPHTFFSCGSVLYTERKKYWVCDAYRKKLLDALNGEAGDAADRG